MKRNPALLDLHLMLAKTRIAQVKISNESASYESDEGLSENVDNSSIQR